MRRRASRNCLEWAEFEQNSGQIPKDMRKHKDNGSRFRGKMVEVTVGDAVEEVFHIHDELLCSGSLFFKVALRPEWREGRERAVKLPEEDPDVFRGYMQYLYTGYVSCTTETAAGYHKLVELWVLGDHLLASTLQNQVIDCILAAAKQPHMKVKATEVQACEGQQPPMIDPAEKHIIHDLEKDHLLYLSSEETVDYVYRKTLVAFATPAAYGCDVHSSRST
ncbi:hypothetical protein LTR27_001021 [Elasticomyces elasticus]|nr:hypothetical protein LTR27_001021 [Elasticomyces elasticus]